MEPNVAKTLAKSSNPERFPGREDLYLTLGDKEAKISWRPAGPGLTPGALLEFAVDTEDLSREEILSGVQNLIGLTPPPGEIKDIFGSKLFKNLLEAGKLTHIADCTLDGVTLSGRDLSDSTLALKNVTLKNSRVCLSAKELNLENVSADDSSLLIDSGGGTWDGVKLSANTTLKGALGKSIIGTDCSFRCRAIHTDFRDVVWREPATLKTRMSGFMFSDKLMDMEVFKTVSRQMTRQEFTEANVRRNREFSAEKLAAILCKAPFGGKIEPAVAAPAPNRTTAAVPAARIRFSVKEKNAQGKTALNSYVVEASALDAKSGNAAGQLEQAGKVSKVIACIYKVDDTPAPATQTVAWTESTSYLTYEDLLIRALEIRKKRLAKSFANSVTKSRPRRAPEKRVWEGSDLNESHMPHIVGE